MKKYYKDGKLVVKPKHLIVRGRTYVNPSDKILTKLGYEIKEEEVVPQVTNESIKKQRQLAYRMRADQYLMAYQAYVELGEHEKASEMKELWIQERTKIDQQYPYLEA